MGDEKPDQDEQKPQKKSADLDALRTILKHPYITGQGLKKETEGADAPAADATPPERESPTD